MQSEELAYLAGIIDGEGCFFIDKIKEPRNPDGFYLRPHLYIYNTSTLLVDWLRVRFPNGWVQASKATPAEKVHLWKHSYRFTVPQPVMRELLPRLIPFLVIKQRHALLMIEYLELNPYWHKQQHTKRVIEIYTELKLLNRKGPQLLSDVEKRVQEVEEKLSV